LDLHRNPLNEEAYCTCLPLIKRNNLDIYRLVYDSCPYSDVDDDGAPDACDNCPDIYNSGQEDIDNDGLGTACDNCPDNYNPLQEDYNPPSGNGIGDVCDCEGNFDCDGDVDGRDATLFKADFGRSTIEHPCITGDTCNGDFNCDGDADGADASLFKVDFGRISIQNPCLACVAGEWCSYPSP
jgi:hypothetical protein